MSRVVRKDVLKHSENCNYDVPIELILESDEEGDFYTIEIDGVFWCETDAPHHAAILFDLIKDGVTKYMHYVKQA